MMKHLFTFSLILLCSTATLSAQNTLNYPTIGEIIRENPELDQLISKDAKIEVVAGGFDWAEGPQWIKSDNKAGGFLVFSDVPMNVIFKWEAGVGISEYLKPSGYTGLTGYSKESGSNGLTVDHKGQLVCCEHGDRRVSVLTKNGGKMTLADRWQGKRFNSPNDVCVSKSGLVYFTDPIYGLPKGENDPLREIDFCGVYLIKNGTVELLTKEFERPNGITLSPDEKTLYVAQSHGPAAIIKSFPVKEDGTIGEGKVVADLTKYMDKLPGAPDGLRTDAKGNIFTTGPGGVWVIKPDGTILGRISTGERTANCAFGGKDGSELFLTSDMWLCKVKTLTKGNGF